MLPYGLGFRVAALNPKPKGQLVSRLDRDHKARGRVKQLFTTPGIRGRDCRAVL